MYKHNIQKSTHVYSALIDNSGLDGYNLYHTSYKDSFMWCTFVMKLYNSPIKIVPETKLLGLLFNSNLTFLPHIKMLKNKCH